MKVGHIGDACIAHKKKEKKHVSILRNRRISVNPLSAYGETECSDLSYELRALNGHTHCPKFLVDVGVEPKSLQFEVDTGAACSLISEETYEKAWPWQGSQISREPLDLRTWSEEELCVLGTADVRVKFKAD